MRLPGLLREVSRCELCVPHLPLGPRPLLRVTESCRILIVGQAPGRVAHESGTPWDDRSGDRLRDWLGVDRETFYTHPKLGLMPMGFCFPGTGKGGDLAPRPECRDAWHGALLEHMPAVESIVAIGRYAQAAYVPEARGRSLTELVKDWRSCFPARIPLPHPSPRNNRWLKRNPWFEEELLPVFRAEVRRQLGD